MVFIGIGGEVRYGIECIDEVLKVEIKMLMDKLPLIVAKLNDTIGDRMDIISLDIHI